MANNCYPFRRLLAVAGYDNMLNDILFVNGCPQDTPKCNVICFGGDVQDFEECMLSHRDNRNWVKWSLESMGQILAERFHNYSPHVWIVRPSEKRFQTISNFNHFVHNDECEPDWTGPQFQWNEECRALRHLLQLLHNSLLQLAQCNTNNNNKAQLFLPWILIGFSKGGIVLTQLLYDMCIIGEQQQQPFDNLALKEMNELKEFLSFLKWIYFLDIGHAGTTLLWPSCPKLLERWTKSMEKLQLKPQISCAVTPYQVRNQMKPWNGKQYVKFIQLLQKLHWPLHSEIHFEDDHASLENHFDILTKFTIGDVVL